MISRFYARSGFWLAYTSHSRSALTLMTPEFRAFVGKRCTNGCLVLHGRRDEFTELVARWKAHFPRLKILRYAKVQRINSGPLVGASFHAEAYERRYDWCILRHKLRGELEPQPREIDGFLWMDITNGDFREAVVQHLVQEVITIETDRPNDRVSAAAAHHRTTADGCKRLGRNVRLRRRGVLSTWQWCVTRGRVAKHSVQAIDLGPPVRRREWCPEGESVRGRPMCL